MDPKPEDLPLDSMSETLEQLEEELIDGEEDVDASDEDSLLEEYEL